MGRGQLDEARRLFAKALTIIESQASDLRGATQLRAEYRAKHFNYYRDCIEILVREHRLRDALEVLERSRSRTLLEAIGSPVIELRASSEVLRHERAIEEQIQTQSKRRIQMLIQPHSSGQLKVVESELAELTKQQEDIKENLRSSSPDYSALTQPKPLSLEEIQKQLLDQDTVLVEYSLAEKRSYAFVVTPDSLAVHELPGRVAIENAARHLHRLLRNPAAASNQGSSSPALSESYKTVASTSSPDHSHAAHAKETEKQTQAADALLSHMVLDPIAGEIGNKRLLIVADGALHYIPFSALLEPAANGVTPQRASQPAQPLIVNHEVILLPSASVLAVLRKQEERKSSPTAEVAVLADPVFDKNDSRVLEARQHSPRLGIEAKSGDAPMDSIRSKYDLSTPPLTRSLNDVGLGRGSAYHLPRLKYTRLEADAIYSQASFHDPAKSNNVLKALDFDASRATATSPDLSRYRIVHFATHGLLNSEHPELSGLVLSLVDRDGRPQDGFLGLQDIYNLNLNADLVVLSACETGLGKEISGEGLIGLTRGFMYAGATRVVASLWKVSDAATAQLMTEFYRSMEQDHLAPAAALRQAQISMWKQKRWSDPYYWAAFQLQGEWK